MTKKMIAQVAQRAQESINEDFMYYANRLCTYLSEALGPELITNMYYTFNDDVIRLYNAAMETFDLSSTSSRLVDIRCNASDLPEQVREDFMSIEEDIFKTNKPRNGLEVDLQLNIGGPFLEVKQDVSGIYEELSGEAIANIVSTTSAILRMAYYTKVANWYCAAAYRGETVFANLGYSAPFLIPYMRDDERKKLVSPLPKSGAYFHKNARDLALRTHQHIQALRIAVGEKMGPRPHIHSMKYLVCPKINFTAPYYMPDTGYMATKTVRVNL